MDFKNVMTEWVSLKTQLASARKDLGTLNEREKELRQIVTTHMHVNEIDTVRVQEKIRVNFKIRKTKGSLTKEVITRGLSTFFGHNDAQVEGAFQAILDAAPTIEKPSVSVTSIKK